MKRRTLLAAAAAAPLASPGRAGAQRSSVVRFIPLGDLAVRDPVRVPAKVTLHHSYMVFDTLYGMDAGFNVEPQMVAGHQTDADGKQWDLTLRDGLRFHDGTPVLARDCVASIRRWAAVDSLGQRLMARTDELSAKDDRTIRFRLREPFPLLPLALGKVQPNMLAIMPERIAATPATTVLTEMVGSGPFRFAADEAIPGARFVYERFGGYVPRGSGTVSQTAGPKVVNVDRVEWHVIPDPGTALAALQSGEMDWWERPVFDLLPTMARNRDLVIWKNDPLGETSTLVLNHLLPPFDNPAICRALLGAFSQADVMAAVAGSDEAYYRTGVGWLPQGSPWANDAGTAPLVAKPDPARTKQALQAAGYNGERVVMIVGSDIPDIMAASQVAAEQMKQAGMAVDFQVSDWGSVIQRRISRKPLAEGGWSCFVTPTPGYYIADPATAPNLRGTGELPSNGFMRSAAVEALYTRWIDAPDEAARHALAAEVQTQLAADVPFIPLGQYFDPTVYRRSIGNMTPGGLIRFWGLTKPHDRSARPDAVRHAARRHRGRLCRVPRRAVCGPAGRCIALQARPSLAAVAW